MSAEFRDDLMFDLLVELSEHAEEQGMREVAESLGAAMDALMVWEAEGCGPRFRSARAHADI